MIGSFSVSRAQIGAQTAHNYVKATVTAILQDDADGLPFNGSQLVRARLTSGTWKGEEVELSNSNSYQRGALCQEGTKIIALVQQGSDGIISGSVYNYDRTGMLWGLLALFLISLLAVGGWKGAATIYALAFTFVCVIFLYLPLLYAGWNGIAASALTAVVVLAASIYILNGWSRKSVCSILGTTAFHMVFRSSSGAAFLFICFCTLEVKASPYPEALWRSRISSHLKSWFRSAQRWKSLAAASIFHIRSRMGICRFCSTSRKYSLVSSRAVKSI